MSSHYVGTIARAAAMGTLASWTLLAAAAAGQDSQPASTPAVAAKPAPPLMPASQLQ